MLWAGCHTLLKLVQFLPHWCSFLWHSSQFLASAGWTGAMARGSHLPLYASTADSGPCEGGSLFDRSPASDMASRLVPGSFTLTRLIVAVPLTDRFICHLVMVTCWDGFTAPVPLTLGCLKSDAASLSLSGGLSAAGITSPPASLFP